MVVLLRLKLLLEAGKLSVLNTTSMTVSFVKLNL